MGRSETQLRSFVSGIPGTFWVSGSCKISHRKLTETRGLRFICPRPEIMIRGKRRFRHLIAFPIEYRRNRKLLLIYQSELKIRRVW